MFTIEINGRAIAVTDADEREAQELINGEDFRRELSRLRTEDGPVWDGSAPLSLRPATEAEIEEFEEPELDEDDEDADEADEDEDEAVVMFLVPIIDDEDESED